MSISVRTEESYMTHIQPNQTSPLYSTLNGTPGTIKEKPTETDVKTHGVFNTTEPKEFKGLNLNEKQIEPMNEMPTIEGADSEDDSLDLSTFGEIEKREAPSSTAIFSTSPSPICDGGGSMSGRCLSIEAP